jgi:alpha-ketoglutarate-dependent taurine dioxygenase
MIPGNKEELFALSAFQNYIRTAEIIQFKLSEGDWLIIDNHRMLHGRKAFLSGSNRILTRYWLSGK